MNYKCLQVRSSEYGARRSSYVECYYPGMRIQHYTGYGAVGRNDYSADDAVQPTSTLLLKTCHEYFAIGGKPDGVTSICS